MQTLNDTIQQIIDAHFQRVAFENYEHDIEQNDDSEDWDELEFYTE